MLLGLLISLLVMTLVFLLTCQRLAKGVLMVLLMVILVSRVLARELGPRRRCLRRQQIERGRPARTSARKIKRKIKAFVFSGGGSPSLGVARNKLSARNHCQVKGRDSNPCPGYPRVLTARNRLGPRHGPKLQEFHKLIDLQPEKGRTATA